MKDKYPVTGALCFMEVEPRFDENIGKGVFARVSSYKGGIYIDVNCFQRLYGDDLDRLITVLRRVKSAWLKGYRKEQKKGAKSKRSKK